MEKIKSLSCWKIFDLWKTDAGKMDFADSYDRDQLRFRVHLHDARTGFDHTSTAYMDGAFFFQMPRAEYEDWARKAVRDPQYARTGLKSMEAVLSRLDMYEHPVRYVMDALANDMGASVGAFNAKGILGKQPWLTFSSAIASHMDEDCRFIYGWVPNALTIHRDVPAVKKIERWFWQELTTYCEDGNIDDFLYEDAGKFASLASVKLKEYATSSISKNEMENLCRTLKKIGRAHTQHSTDVQLIVQGVRFADPDEVCNAWHAAQEDNDIFPGVGSLPAFEVIPHG